MTEARILNQPGPGWWRVRLSKRSVWVGARIYFARAPEHLLLPVDPWPNSETRILGVFADIDGKPTDPNRVWEMRGEEITEAEYLYLVENARWTRDNAPEDPAARPYEPVDYLTVRPPFE